MAFTFKTQKSVDQILSAFTTVRNELAQAMVSLHEAATSKEHQISVLRAEIDAIDNESIRAARALQKAEELLGN